MGTKEKHKLNVPIRGWVDILLYFHHRKVAHELRNIGLEFDRVGNRVLEIGSGKKPCGDLFGKANFTCTDVFRYDWVDQLVDVRNMSCSALMPTR